MRIWLNPHEAQIAKVDISIIDVFGILYDAVDPEWDRLELILNQNARLYAQIAGLTKDFYDRVREWISEQEMDISKQLQPIEGFLDADVRYNTLREQLSNNYAIVWNNNSKENRSEEHTSELQSDSEHSYAV